MYAYRYDDVTAALRCLQECDISRKATRCLPRMPMELPRDLLPEEPDYFTADFNAEKAQMSVHSARRCHTHVSRGVAYDIG